MSRNPEHNTRGGTLNLSSREALALLAALELAPFDDEVLEQKLLTLVYSKPTDHARRRQARNPDFRHLRGQRTT